MIKDCHSFERRIQQLMDGRIDPETDEGLWRHGAECPDCYQSLMACSLMHSEFLNDSDSMKIKLETIGLQDLRIRKQEKPRMGYFVAVAASLAAILLVSISLLPTQESGVTTQQVALKSARSDVSPGRRPSTQYSVEEAAASLSSLRETLDPFEIASMTSDWSPIQPIRTLSACFDWIQRSWRRSHELHQETEVGELRNLRRELFYADTTLLLACRG